MKRKFLKTHLSLLLLFVFTNISNVSAYEQKNIPEIMQPNTIIEYTSDSNFEIKKGGFLNSEDLSVKENQMKENQLIADKVLQKHFSNESINKDYNLTEKITPIKGMIVTYADDGLILNIEYPKNVDNPLLKQNNQQTRGAILPSGVTLVRTWGSTPNKLYVDKNDNTIFGTGRATTFNDKVGQGNHTLKKGDVATKLSYDNCKLGISVKVTSNKNKGSGSSLTKTMTKWDAGGMPNAIVDIWKTGLEYWGYTYNSSLSLKGITSIEHQNIDINGKKLY